MNDSLNIILANTRQATDACHKIMLRKSSPRKKVRIFLSKKFLLNPEKSSLLILSFLSFANKKSRTQNTSRIIIRKYFQRGRRSFFKSV